MELLIAFGVGLAVGFVSGAVPDLLKHRSYTKSLEQLSAGRPVDPLEDEEDVAEKEKKREEEIGFWV